MDNTNIGAGSSSGHPIEGLMKTAMESIKGMVDVNTVVGEAVQTRDGSTIIPISKVSFGFAAGGGEYFSHEEHSASLPFGGGSGAGVTVSPVGFLVAHGDTVRMLSVEKTDMVDTLMSSAPQLIDQIQGLFQNKKDDKTHHDEKSHRTLIDPHSMS